MEIIVADNAGFCFGVTRAVDIALKNKKEKGSPGKTYTLGPLIHNKDVVDSLKESGIYPLNLEDIGGLEAKDTVVIRSHGVTPQIIDEIKGRGAHIIDATCPYVTSIQRKVRKYHNEGYEIIIVGNKDHPEVVGINGWCDNKAIITKDGRDLGNLPQKVCLVSQTTERLINYETALEAVSKKCERVLSFNTICSATGERQESAHDLSKKVDLMIVIGGKDSSNSKKLYEICMKNYKNTIFIENKAELLDFVEDNKILHKVKRIGITAGASTPDWIINDVIDILNELGEKENND